MLLLNVLIREFLRVYNTHWLIGGFFLVLFEPSFFLFFTVIAATKKKPTEMKRQRGHYLIGV